jgi:hypothetical protein
MADSVYISSRGCGCLPGSPMGMIISVEDSPAFIAALDDLLAGGSED